MGFPIKVCVVCEEEFELKPDKPGFANRCWECSVPEAQTGEGKTTAEEGGAERNEARRAAIRELLYRKDS